jgi:multiple sugar transport system substrate-binding protein
VPVAQRQELDDVLVIGLTAARGSGGWGEPIGVARRALSLCTLGLVVLAGCGDESSSGAVALDWFIFNEPSGAPVRIAERCSQQSDGRYDIEFRYLPSSADAQREQVVRRLAAEDDTIDLIGMDIIWTGEFANAGWIREVPAEIEQELTGEVFESVLASARFEDRLYAVPIWSNTQLLWYRTDRVDRPPQTWDEMLEQAERIGPSGTIQVQADRYEGPTVWATAMIHSAGTRILSGPQEIALERRPTERAPAIMGRVSRSAAPPDVSTSSEDSVRLGFESGNSSFMVNYPFVHPSARQDAPEVFEHMGAAITRGWSPTFRAPRRSAGSISRCRRSRRTPILRRGDQVSHPAREPARDRGVGRAAAGRPGPLRAVGDRAHLPGFSDLIRESIEAAEPRPSESPAYQDLSLAIQRALHPTTDIDPDNPTPTYERLRTRIEQPVERRGLL